MQSLFARLDLPESLDLDPERITSSWREASQDPDPRSDDERSSLNQARETLTDPVARLEHWLELRGVTVTHAAGLSAELLGLFEKVGPVLSEADQIVTKFKQAESAIAKAVLTAPAVKIQLSIQSLLAQIQSLRSPRLEKFPAIEIDPAIGNELLAELKFLRKWESECQRRLIALIEIG